MTSKAETAGKRRHARSNTAGDWTAAQFLDAAERLCARYGYEGTRTRAQELDSATSIAELVAFISAGLMAPAAGADAGSPVGIRTGTPDRTGAQR